MTEEPNIHSDIDEPVKTEEEINIDETEKEAENKVKGPSWSELKFIPNKKRFIILTIVISVLELGGLLTLAYAFITEENPAGFYDFGIFILAPTMGLFVSYLVAHKKEAVAVSFINAITSIPISLIIYILVEKYQNFPQAFVFSIIEHFAVPALFILIQIGVAFTLTRFRRTFSSLADPTIERKRDKELVAELRASRIARGLEPDPDQAKISDEVEEEEIIENTTN
ncbi:MAG TPA: hypothetical protein VMZ29_04840 [Candidatus Bathyarchaeia archaeon]|nr:hypothetical protein [Candidatus Bathyarchaeia archaeon]